MRLQSFDSTVSSWTNWASGFKVAVKRICSTAYGLMREAEKMSGDATDDILEVDCGKVTEISGEIYRLLCQYVTGPVGDDYCKGRAGVPRIDGMAAAPSQI